MFDNDILIDNIRMLMANNHTTQNELANVLGMSQPNLNRALNQVDGKRFTVEQIFGIASHYRVSIDWLVGNTDSSFVSDKAICDFFSKVILSKKAKIWTFEKEEKVIEGSYEGGSGKPEPKKVPYTTFYFPKYIDVSSPEYEYEDDDFFIELSNCGNGTDNYRINGFIEKYAKLYDIYFHGDMDEEDFQTLIKKHLDSIEN